EEISEAEAGAMLSRLTAMDNKLGRLAELDGGLKPVLEVLEPARIQLQEAAYALRAYLDKLELDPQRLREVDARVDAIHSAARKFRLEADALPGELERLSAELATLSQASDLEGLRAREKELEQQ